MGGWLPALALTPQPRYGETVWATFWVIWIVPFVAALVLIYVVKSNLQRGGSSAAKVILEKDKIVSAGSAPKAYDRSDIGDLWSKTDTISLKYNSNNYASKKKRAEASQSIRCYVSADYGTVQVTLIPASLTEQQAVAIRDLIANWRDGPKTIIDALSTSAAA